MNSVNLLEIFRQNAGNTSHFILKDLVQLSMKFTSQNLKTKKPQKPEVPIENSVSFGVMLIEIKINQNNLVGAMPVTWARPLSQPKEWFI